MRDLLEFLKMKGYKLTRPRQAVLAVLQRVKKPLSAREIKKKLGSGFDLVSVYRSLELFVQLGVAYFEQIASEKYYYLGASPHHHIRCKVCGRVDCLPCKHEFVKVSKFKNVTHQLVLEGICSRCQ